MGFCIQFNSDCSDKDTKVAREVAGQFCDVAGQSPSQDTLASVSSIIMGGVAKATATSTSSSASTNAAGVVGKGTCIQMAVYVAAAAAVL
ncbi:HET domain containing protein [Colletotrichum musicola]|uniref:HET domain containing protein n=1 Tax=Colletotrichum musicola TaxID=2175873 RepID=A0A8H6IL90_9PEZI|nr:HET domain containing protein [Colletotrichum musicola]